MRNILQPLFNVQTLLFLALILALAGSLKHLASVFASVDSNTAMGWVQAIAIDAGLFALAYSIRQRKAARRSTRILWLGVTMFSAISIYGNLAYGLTATGNLPGWIETVKPYILAGSLPVLVLFLSELLSDDRQHAGQIAAKEAKRQAANESGNTGATPEKAGSLASINAAKAATKAEKLEQLSFILAEQPQATNTELAARLEVSRGTIRNYRQELATNGNERGQQ